MASQEIYDFIIIGSGTASRVLAQRLTAEPQVRVLWLEIGQSPRVKDQDAEDFADWPSRSGEDAGQPFWSVPQKYLYGEKLRYWSHITTEGLSIITSLNDLQLERDSIDAWASLGNEGWDWETLEPYYREFRQQHALQSIMKSELRPGHSSPSCASIFSHTSSNLCHLIGSIVWQRLVSLGWKAKYDHPSIPITIRTARQHETISDAPNQDRTIFGSRQSIHHQANCFRKTGVVVTKIILNEGEELTATGVEFNINDSTHVAYSRREIILATGAFHTPQLLELSGIGSRRILEELGLDVRFENNYVGENMQDQVMTSICVQPRPDASTAESSDVSVAHYNDWPISDGMQDIRPWMKAEAVAFLPLRRWADEVDLQSVVDAQLDANSPIDKRPSRMAQAQQLREVILSEERASIQLCLTTLPGPAGKGTDRQPSVGFEMANCVAVTLILPRPLSAGSCHINSTNSRDPPIVDPQVLSHPLDTEVLGRHLVAIYTLLEAGSLTGYIKSVPDSFPGDSPLFAAGNSPFDRAVAGRDHVRRHIRSADRPSGTCSMLPADLGGVVDARLRVYGVKRLRIVDSSIFPMAVLGDFESTLYAVAQRAADLILEEWPLT